MSQFNWSESLRSDLDKLSALGSKKPESRKIELKEGERRVVTILFLDIQGFTAMSEKLDPEDVQLIIDQTFKILTNEIEKFHGFIDKYEGDRLMALFGSRHATEQDCEMALRAALGMQEKFLTINQILKEKNIQVGMRIGVNTGLVVTGRIGKGRDQDFTVMGDAVNLASRLESNAPINQIMIGEDVKKIVEGVFVFQNMGEIQVKGKSKPIQVYCVNAVSENRTQRWERSELSKKSKFVGRSNELRLLNECYLSASTSRGVSGVVIQAQAGTGKSRLIHEFLKSKNDHHLISASCLTSHLMPYMLLGDLFKPLFVSFDFESFLKKDLATYERLMPVINYLCQKSVPDERMKSLDPAALNLEIHLALKLVIESLPTWVGSQKVIVLWLDDVQWMDEASVEAFKFLFSNLNGKNPIMVIITSRPDVDVVKKMGMGAGTIELHLNPLGLDDCVEIIHNAFEKDLFLTQEKQILVDKSAGNPFYMEELIQSLIDEDIVVKEGDGWKKCKEVNLAHLPDSIHRIIVGRIDRLSSDDKLTLMAASVLFDPINSQIMNAIRKDLGLKSQDLQWADALEQLAFLQRESHDPIYTSWTFRHSMIREVVYGMILNQNKRILHECVANALEKYFANQLEGKAKLLFHHYSNTSNVEKIKEYGKDTLKQLFFNHASNEGLLIIKTLQELVQSLNIQDEEFISILLQYEAKFHDFMGMREFQLNVIDKLKALKSTGNRPEQQVQYNALMANYYLSIGQFQKAIEQTMLVLDQSMLVQAPLDVVIDLYRVAGIAKYSLGEFQKANDYYLKGLSMAQKKNDRYYEATFYNAMGLVKYQMGKSNEALDDYQKSLSIHQSLGHLRGQSNALGNQGLVYWGLGEYSKALMHLNASYKIFEEVGFKKGQAVTLGNIGVIYHKLGLYNMALDHYHKALNVRIQISDLAGQGYDHVNLGVVYTHLGDFVKAMSYFERGLDLAKGVDSKYLIVENLNGLAIIHRTTQQNEGLNLMKAKDYALEAVKMAQEYGLIPGQVKALSNLGRIFLLMHDKVQALKHSQEALRLIQNHPSGVEGSEEEALINHYTVLLGVGEKEKAIETLEKMISLIESRAKQISDETFKKNFLTEVRHNRYAILEWKKYHPQWKPKGLENIF